MAQLQMAGNANVCRVDEQTQHDFAEFTAADQTGPTKQGPHDEYYASSMQQ